MYYLAFVTKGISPQSKTLFTSQIPIVIKHGLRQQQGQVLERDLALLCACVYAYLEAVFLVYKFSKFCKCMHGDVQKYLKVLKGRWEILEASL